MGSPTSVVHFEYQCPSKIFSADAIHAKINKFVVKASIQLDRRRCTINGDDVDGSAHSPSGVLPSSELDVAPTSVAKYVEMLRLFLDARRFAEMHQRGDGRECNDVQNGGKHDAAVRAWKKVGYFSIAIALCFYIPRRCSSISRTFADPKTLKASRVCRFSSFCRK